MTSRALGRRLVVATHNAGKLREISALVALWGVEALSAAQLGLPEPEETGTTFADNALLKARAAAEGAQLPALADDSGLSVTALGGEPGVYSARWAGPQRDFAMAMERVAAALEGLPDRSATFFCVLALAWPDGASEVFQGRIDGTIVWPARGTRGFGYDPIFQPLGSHETFGEMDPAAKQAMSHRARAFAALDAWLSQR